MKNLKLNTSVLALTVLLIAGNSLRAAQKLNAEGYQIQLKPASIELAFPACVR